MIDKTKLSQAIGFLANKYGGFRALAVATNINRQSLVNYSDGVTEPRGKNLEIIAREIRKPVTYFLGEDIPPADVHLPTDEEDLSPVGKAKRVLDSGTIYGEALLSNINAFYRAVEMEKKEAYKLPKVAFSKRAEEPIVAKDCCQNENSRQEVTANNVISFNKYGRGGRI